MSSTGPHSMLYFIHPHMYIVLTVVKKNRNCKTIVKKNNTYDLHFFYLKIVRNWFIHHPIS